MESPKCELMLRGEMFSIKNEYIYAVFFLLWDSHVLFKKTNKHIVMKHSHEREAKNDKNKREAKMTQKKVKGEIRGTELFPC